MKNAFVFFVGLLVGSYMTFLSAEEAPSAAVTASTKTDAPQGEPMKIEKDSLVQMEYTVTLADGTMVDHSAEGQPFEYIHGQGQIIPGLERQMEGLQKGDSRDLVIPPEEAYGPNDPNAIQEIQKNQLAPGIEPKVGMRLRGTNPQGDPFTVLVKEIKDQTLVVDFNHPLAGQTLRFHVKVLDVQKIKSSQTTTSEAQR